MSQGAVSHGCHSSFSEQPVLQLQGGGRSPSDTHKKAKNRRIQGWHVQGLPGPTAEQPKPSRIV